MPGNFRENRPFNGQTVDPLSPDGRFHHLGMVIFFSINNPHPGPRAPQIPSLWGPKTVGKKKCNIQKWMDTAKNKGLVELLREHGKNK